MTSSRANLFVLGAAIVAVVTLISIERTMTPLVGVNEIVRDPKRFDGRLLRVRGWIGRCAGEDCAIAEDEQFFKQLSHPDPAFIQRLRAREIGLLAIAYDPKFDDQVSRLLGRPIIVTARFSAACFKPNYICLDRAPDLTPASWAPPHPAEED